MLKMTSKIKKLWSLLLVMVMVLSMGMISSAATDYPNLTNYNTDYSYTFGAGKESTKDLMVQLASGDYAETTLFASQEAAENVTWTVLSDSTKGVTATAHGFVEVDGKYAAKTTVTVEKDATPGVAVVEATVPGVTPAVYMDFTIVVNPESAETATDVEMYVYGLADSGIEFDALDVKGKSLNFATVMDAMVTFKGVNHSFSYTDPYPGYITSMTYGEDTKSAEGLSGWNYRIYNKVGKNNYIMNNISTVVGANVCKVNNNSRIVWMYGTSDQAEKFFTDNFANLPVK